MKSLRITIRLDE